MTTLECKSLAALVSCEGIGQMTVNQLIRELRAAELSWEEFWESDENIWQKLLLSKNKIESIKKFINEQTIDAYFESLMNRNIRVITHDSREYPPLLKELENSPAVLFAKGKQLEWQVADQRSLPIAVVGTRHMTAYGKMVTEKITRELVGEGAVIVSGFMYGVDTWAHRTALENKGKTVGVLGYGFDYVYPRSHQAIFDEFLANGMTFISPFAPSVKPTQGNFPARNSVVAGMSAAVVVTEAAEKSGTHITAGIAADLGRPVCAIPGAITSPYSQGTKWLINQGATLVSAGFEVLEVVAFDGVGGDNSINTELLTQDQRVIYDDLAGQGSCSVDALVESQQKSVGAVLTLLTELELLGLVFKQGENWLIKSR